MNLIINNIIFIVIIYISLLLSLFLLLSKYEKNINTSTFVTCASHRESLPLPPPSTPPTGPILRGGGLKCFSYACVTVIASEYYITIATIFHCKCISFTDPPLCKKFYIQTMYYKKNKIK